MHAYVLSIDNQHTESEREFNFFNFFCRFSFPISIPFPHFSAIVVSDIADASRLLVGPLSIART